MSEIDRIFEIRSNNLKPAKGKLLLSEPLMGDYYFGRSVVLLAEHNDEGSFGVIMNKPVTAKFNDVIKDFPKFDTSIFIGGPVETNKLFYIHTFGEEVQDAIEIADGVYWGGNLEIIKEMVFLGRANNQNLRFFIGYSGWGANQLDSELKKNSWIITKADKDVFFNTHPAQMWDTLMRNMGGKYRYWTKFPSDPGLN
jgi:putative transcriptional regulator